MRSSLIKSILLLPGMALVVIPGALLWLSRGTALAPKVAQPNEIRFWLALLILIVGIILAAWTVRLQITLGKGTPVPWDPTQKLVVAGPYRHVRNPMMSGAFSILLGEALLFGSWLIAAWIGLFVIFNLFYTPLVEEKELEGRFGEEYLTYKANVPRWLPRLRPWNNAEI